MGGCEATRGDRTRPPRGFRHEIALHAAEDRVRLVPVTLRGSTRASLTIAIPAYHRRMNRFDRMGATAEIRKEIEEEALAQRGTCAVSSFT